MTSVANLMAVPGLNSDSFTERKNIARLVRKNKIQVEPNSKYSTKPRFFPSFFPGKNSNSSTKYPGKTKALFIGINYVGTAEELRGCINDAHQMSKFLSSYFSFPQNRNDVMIMTDESKNVGTPAYPTRDNIISAMKWLVSGAEPGDSLFIHYSGHGGFKKDKNSEEIDGYDETIYPLDYRKNGILIDDEIFQLLIAPLPKGARLNAFFDSCHSGTVMDLPYLYNPDGKDLIAAQKPPTPSFMSQYLMMFMFSGLRNTTTKSRPRDIVKYRRTHPARRSIQADVFCFSGCRDDQLSMDVCDGTGCYGAMSRYWISCLKKNTKQTYHELLVAVRQVLKSRGFSQIACLSSNQKLDLDVPFAL